MYLAEAISFFNEMAREYAHVIIPVIHRHKPDAFIVLGTPYFDREIQYAAEDPVPFENVMYAFHFYATSHTNVARAKLYNVVKQGTPIFITESGLCEESLYAELVALHKSDGKLVEGVTTKLTEHSVDVFVDEVELSRFIIRATLKCRAFIRSKFSISRVRKTSLCKCSMTAHRHCRNACVLAMSIFATCGKTWDGEFLELRG